MQSDNSSQSQSPSQESLTSASPTPSIVPPMADDFSITREDAKILGTYVEQFEEGNAELRNTIIANAMGELSELRPDGILFNKIEASKVSFQISQRCNKLIFYSEN